MAGAEAELKYQACLRLGDQVFIAGQIDRAAAIYREAIAAKATPEARQRLGRALAREWASQGREKAGQGDWQAALAAYQKAQQLDPEGPFKDQISRARGMAAYEAKLDEAGQVHKLGRHAEAIAILKELLALRHDREARRLLDQVVHDKRMAEARQLEKNGDYAAAAAAYRQALRAVDSPAAEQKLAMAEHKDLVQRGDAKAQAREWEAGADLYARAISFVDSEEARGKLAKARGEVAYVRHVARARRAARAGEIDEAIAAAKSAIEVKPAKEAHALLKELQLGKWQRLAEASSGRADWQGAAEAYERLAEIDPRPEFSRKGAEARAEEGYRRAYERGREAADAGDWPAAFDAFQAACEAKMTPEAEAKRRAAGFHKHMAEGNALAAKQQWAAAASAFNKARSFMPTEEVDLALARAEGSLAYQKAFDRGMEAAAKRSWQEAVEAFEEALKYKSRFEAKQKLKESKHFLLMALGQDREQAHEWDRAVECYQAAKAVWPRPGVQARIFTASYYMWFAEALSHKARGDAANARDAFARAVNALVAQGGQVQEPPRHGPGEPSAASTFRQEFSAALRLERSGEWAQAIQHYRQSEVHAIDPRCVRDRIDRCLKRFVKE